MAARLALTLGDPAGIGPEIALKALASTRRPAADISVYGPVAALRERASRFGLRPPESLGVRLVDVPAAPVPLGVAGPAGGRAAAESVLAAELT